jgi:hypothetical protein
MPKGFFDNGAGYTNTNAFVSQTLTHLDKRIWEPSSVLNTSGHALKVVFLLPMVNTPMIAILI